MTSRNMRMHGRKTQGVDFAAIDVEAANEALASTCQIEVVGFHKGQAADQ